MRVFQVRSEKTLLAEIRFHGDTVDAAGEARIIQGTEPTLEAILEILGHALVQSKAMTAAEKTKKAAPPPALPTPSAEGGPATAPANDVVADLSAFRAKKGKSRPS